MTNNFFSSLKIIEKLSFQRPDFWHDNYHKMKQKCQNYGFFRKGKAFFKIYIYTFDRSGLSPHNSEEKC